MRTLLATSGLLLALVPPAAAAAPALPDTITRSASGGWTIWRIDRPTVDARRLVEGRAVAYPDVALHPGDVVRIEAGGCVRTSARPGSWRPYAQVARVSIPTATEGAVPLAEVAGRELIVHGLADPAELRLELSTATQRGAGYDGARPESGPCAGQPDAYLVVAARPADAPYALAAAPMDLVSVGTTDPNSMWLNPQWGIQQTAPGSLGNPKACFNLSGWFNNPACTVQRPGIDEPTGATWLICWSGSTTPIEGHVNWYPATYKGPVYWSDQSWPDMDYNIRLVPPTRNGLTLANTTSIKGEFDARETIDHFTTPWWRAFRGASDATKKLMIDGREGIMAGLIGTDCEHDCYSEIHPVWALAIHVKNDPNDDVWAIFVRNFGNEGFCSRYQHLVNFPSHRFTFNFPWRSGATSVATTTGTAFYANQSGMSYSWGSTPGQKVSLSVQLLSPYSYPRVHGELHLRWTGASLRDGEAATAPQIVSFEEKGGGRAERWITELLEKLEPERRAQVEAELAAFYAPQADAAPIGGRRAAAAEPETALSEAVAVTAVPDASAAQANLRRLAALRRAYGGALPGPVGEALERFEAAGGRLE